MRVRVTYLAALFLSAFYQCAFSQVVCHGKKALLIDEPLCDDVLPYTLVFEDNFNGQNLDTSVWRRAYGVERDMEHVYTQQWYSHENVIVSDGTLKIITKRDTLLNKCYSLWTGNGITTSCEDFYYSSGQIDTHKKFSHGKFEISCKIPNAQGVGSSFWTFGDPARNEIDVFEFEYEAHINGSFNEKKNSHVVRMNIHTDYDGDDHTEDCPNKYNGPDFSKDFHTFAVEWTPHKIEWLVDGEVKRTSTLFYTVNGQMLNCDQLHKGEVYIKDIAFPLNPMVIVFDGMVHSHKKAPGNETVLPAVYEIDYIRYWQKVP